MAARLKSQATRVLSRPLSRTHPTHRSVPDWGAKTRCNHWYRLRDRSASAPRYGRVGFAGPLLLPPSDPDSHVLQRQVLVDSLGAALAAEAGLLDPAERGGGV